MTHQLYDHNMLIPLKDRDAELEELWAELEDVPMDPDTECIEAPFLHFPAGTHREDIWHWFDDRHSEGVSHLLYGGGEDHTRELAQMAFCNCLCKPCDSEYCAFNPQYVCMYPLVYGAKPSEREDGQCEGFCYKEGRA